MFWRNLLSTSARTTVAAVAGSAATASGVDSDWYRRLDKPAFQPPPAAFPIAWTLLYADIAVTSAAVLTELQQRARPGLRRRDRPRRPIEPPRPEHVPSAAAGRERGYRRALTLNLVLNAGWCWAFFARRNTALGTVTAVALTASSADLARRAARSRPLYGAALAPYAGWCGFATVLSARIHQLNP